MIKLNLSEVQLNVTVQGESIDFSNITFNDIVEIPNFLSVAQVSPYSWLETDVNSILSGTFEPSPNEWGGEAFTTIFSLPLPIGGLIMVSDPTMFTNQYLTNSNYDNLQLAVNMIDYLSQLSSAGFLTGGAGGFNSTMVDGTRTGAPTLQQTSSKPKLVIFDEGHLFRSPINPMLYFSSFLRYINSITMFPFFAPLIPFFIGGIAYRFVPKQKRLKPLLLTRIRAVTGKSKLDRHLTRIKEARAYHIVLGLLYMKLKRIFAKKYKTPIGIEAKDLAEELYYYYGDKYKRKQLHARLRRIEKIVKNKMSIDEEEFMELGLFLKDLIALIAPDQALY